jgi:uncharacterized protein YkwD
MFQSEDHPAIDLLDFDENDANAPFEITTPLNTAKNATSLQDSRELESVRSVTIINQCTEQGFFLAIIYREEATGEMVHRGWYNVPSFHRVTFDDVLDGKYSMYALSHDFRFDWGEDPNKATHCFNERCYRDFSYPNSNSWQYLSCNSGSQPTPAPSPPTPAPVYNTPLTDREQQWVDAHNSRRQTIHSQYGKSFKPVQWSSSLADSAQGYADKLASVTATDCYIAHGYQGDSYGGENIASNWGSSSYDFESPEAVLTRWFENEADDEWPQNGVSLRLCIAVWFGAVSMCGSSSHVVTTCSPQYSIEHKWHGEGQTMLVAEKPKALQWKLVLQNSSLSILSPWKL